VFTGFYLKNLSLVMSTLRFNLKKKLLENGLSASALEKKAGIRPSSLQNILQGRSKNPSIEILQLSARALNCTVSELLGENSKSAEIEPFCAAPSRWDQELYIQMAEAVFRVYAGRHHTTSKRVLLQAIEQVYTYCLQYAKKTVDDDLVDWVITNLIQAEKEG